MGLAAGTVIRGVRAALYRVLDVEDGQGLAEYGLILAFIALVAILALTFMGRSISSLLSLLATVL
jgi:Flp pilus assembly pilin Flp